MGIDCLDSCLCPVSEGRVVSKERLATIEVVIAIGALINLYLWLA